MEFPISQHPLFEERWDDYAKKFNRLAEILEDYGLGVALLSDVVEATKKLEELYAEVGYQTGLAQAFVTRDTDCEQSYNREINSI